MVFDVTNFGYNSENLKDIISINNKLNLSLRDNIEEILKDYQNPNLDKYKPKGGYEFIDKSNNDGLGIYHTHLCKLDSKIWVLIWYLRENNQNYFDIFFEVMIHPSDDYKQVLSDIKNDPMNINPYTWKHFLEKLKILNYTNFLNFIK